MRVAILGLFLVVPNCLATEVAYEDFVVLPHLNLGYCSDGRSRRFDTAILY